LKKLPAIAVRLLEQLIFHPYHTSRILAPVELGL